MIRKEVRNENSEVFREVEDLRLESFSMKKFFSSFFSLKGEQKGRKEEREQKKREDFFFERLFLRL